MDESPHGYDYAMELGTLGYPEFSYLKGATTPDPARLLLSALNESDLDSRIAEALPWLAWVYVDMDWGWLVETATVHLRQNRLGFVVSLATELAQRKNNSERASKLQHQLEILEMSRLSEEDTLCHDSMTKAERVWVREHRSSAAVPLELARRHESGKTLLCRVATRRPNSRYQRIGHYPLITDSLSKGSMHSSRPHFAFGNPTPFLTVR